MSAEQEAAAARASTLRLNHALPELPDCWDATMTRPFAFHTLAPPGASSSLAMEQLRELSSRREALAAKRTGLEGRPDAGAEERAAADYAHWPHKYLALLERLVQQARSHAHLPISPCVAWPSAEHRHWADVRWGGGIGRGAAGQQRRRQVGLSVELPAGRPAQSLLQAHKLGDGARDGEGCPPLPPGPCHADVLWAAARCLSAPSL